MLVLEEINQNPSVPFSVWTIFITTNPEITGFLHPAPTTPTLSSVDLETMIKAAYFKEDCFQSSPLTRQGKMKAS